MSLLRCTLYVAMTFLVTIAPILAAPATSAEPYRVAAFAGSSNWPFWVAQAQGLFAREGLSVTLDITPNSVEIAKRLQAGRIDLALMSVDNVVAYDEGQGEADFREPAQFVALFGVDSGLLNLVAAPSIASVGDLRGKTLSVDALTTGFAFVLLDVLARRGLDAGDVKLARVGGGAQRLESLLSGGSDATLLNTPLDLIADGRGLHMLVRIGDELGAYQGVVGAVTREAARRDRVRIASFIRGLAAGVAWLTDPANRRKATTLLSARMSMDTALADKSYDILVAGRGGIFRNLKIDRDGMKAVLLLRSRYATPPKILTDPNRYMDDSIRTEALGP